MVAIGTVLCRYGPTENPEIMAYGRDGAFHQVLIANPVSTARRLGIVPGPAPLVMMENTDTFHNVVVYTLGS
jgi:hypothetical protein